ncbi:uncharacterized protein [Mytilus edulis]|uniref:uncharacterized protein n=1 Tax=Mytilus edulis TaxID=6550 RepID=UPI0039EECD0B
MALSKVADMPSLTEEETNFLRFANLLIRISPKAVRMVFDKYFQPCGLNVVLNQSKGKLESLKHKKVLNKSQIDILYPSQGTMTVKSTDMDLTLMICLLRHLQKMKFEDSLSLATNTSEAADLSRIKYYRNWIAHNTNGQISKHDFPAIWKNASEAIGRLGGQLLKTECDILMSSDLDSSNKEVILSFAQQERRLEKVEKEYDKVDEELQYAKEKINQLQESKDNTKDNLLLQVDDWEQSNDKCFPTSAVKTVLETVMHTSFVVISGSAGMGKSAMAYHIGLLFRDTKEYEILPIHEPSDILKFCQSGRNQIVIIDDICGKFSINKHNVDSWMSLKSSIKQVVKQCKTSLRIVATCRLHIRKTKQFEKLINEFEMKDCNLLSDEMALELDEKHKIGLCHLNQECLDQLPEKVIAQTDMFPLLCKLSAEKTFNPGFFEKPYDIFEKELGEMATENIECFFGLVLLVLFNNNLRIILFEDRSNRRFNEIFEEVFEELDMSSRPSKSSVLHSLKTLKGTFIKESECSFSAIHDQVFDFIAFFIGKMLLKTILKYGRSTFIAERMSFKFLVEITTDNDFVIMLDETHKELYFRRIEEEIRGRKFSTVFCNIIAKTLFYQEKIISLCFKQSGTFSILTGNVWPLILSAYSDCNMIFTFLEKERLKRMNCEQVSETESEVGGALRNVFFDTQISFDEYDNEASHELSSSNGPLLTVVTWERVDLMQCLLQSYKTNSCNALHPQSVTILVPDMAGNLVKYKQLPCLPSTTHLYTQYDGRGLPRTTYKINAKWQKTCHLNTELKRAKIRHQKDTDDM